jgi:hypothetical protein
MGDAKVDLGRGTYFTVDTMSITTKFRIRSLFYDAILFTRNALYIMGHAYVCSLQANIQCILSWCNLLLTPNLWSKHNIPLFLPLLVKYVVKMQKSKFSAQNIIRNYDQDIIAPLF